MQTISQPNRARRGPRIVWDSDSRGGRPRILGDDGRCQPSHSRVGARETADINRWGNTHGGGQRIGQRGTGLTISFETRNTYDRIASDYAAKTCHRLPLQASFDRFLDHLSPGSVVIDVGCGPGFDTVELRRQGMRAVGVDYSWNMMQTGKRQYRLEGPYVQADMRWLPFCRAAGGLWACASLLHIRRDDVPRALAGFARVLKPEGILYLSVKLGQGEEWTDFSCGQAARRFFVYWQPEALDAVLDAAGFDQVEGWLEEAGDTTWLGRLVRKRGT